MLLLPFQCLWCACCVFTRFTVVSSCFLSLGEKLIWREELGIRNIQTPARTLHCSASNSKYSVDLSNKKKMPLWFSLSNFTAESKNQSSRKSYLLAPGLATSGRRLPSGFEAVCLPPHPLSLWYPVNACLWPLLSKSICWISDPWAPQTAFAFQGVLGWLSRWYSAVGSTCFWLFCCVCCLYFARHNLSDTSNHSAL